MKLADYYFNYCGQVIDIRPYSKDVFILFKSGGGFGDGGADRTGWSTYDLLHVDSGNLVKVGEGSESGNGYTKKCQFTIGDTTHHIEGLFLDQIFKKIFKRE